MTDDLYRKVRNRVERRLSKSPRLVTIHALLFTFFSVPVGLWSLRTHSGGSIHGVVYWTIFFWSIGLLIHASYLFLHSGAWRGAREKYIQEEVLDAGESYDLEGDELIDLHVHLADDIQMRSQVFSRLLLNALGNLVLWPGVLVTMMVVYGLEIIPPVNFSSAFNSVLTLALLGTLILGIALPVRELSKKKSKNHDDLRAIYGYKRKRHERHHLDDTEERVKIGDDGEFVELETETRMDSSLT
jgi:hypothetical protein